MEQSGEEPKLQRRGLQCFPDAGPWENSFFGTKPDLETSEIIGTL